MKAKLINASLTTRVIVPDDTTDDQVFEIAQMRLIQKIESFELLLNAEITDDTECPYDPEIDEETLDS